MQDKLVELGDEEMSEEEAARYTAMEEQAEVDAAREIRAQKVNMRWSKDQVDLIRRAAAIYGIPYQTYLKQAAVRQALADIELAQRVDARRAS